MTKGDRVGSDGRFRYGNSMGQGECPLCLEKEGPFPLVNSLRPLLFGHIYNGTDNEI